MSRLALTLIVGYLSIQVHEAGHWLVFRLLGSRRAIMGFSRELVLNDELNRLLEEGMSLRDALIALPETYVSAEWVAILGGAFVLQFGLVLLGLVFLRRSRRPIVRQTALLVLLFNGGRALLLLRALLGRGTAGDEAMIAFQLGVPERAVVLPLTVVFGMALLVGASQVRRVTGGLAVAVMTGPVGWGLMRGLPRLDEVLALCLRQGSAICVDVVGIALPVLVVDLGFVATVVGLAWWSWKGERPAHGGGPP